MTPLQVVRIVRGGIFLHLGGLALLVATLVAGLGGGFEPWSTGAAGLFLLAIIFLTTGTIQLSRAIHVDPDHDRH